MNTQFNVCVCLNYEIKIKEKVPRNEMLNVDLNFLAYQKKESCIMLVLQCLIVSSRVAFTHRSYPIVFFLLRLISKIYLI